MKLTLHPEAERDLQEAAAFYEQEGSPALAARFVTEFKRVARLLADHPEIGVPRTDDKRGFRMSIFPYTVLYRIDGAEIRILVVKHDGRRPGYGGRRE